MPFYEYECQNCKFYTELLQKISDPPLAKCPSCGKKQMKKLVSAPMFRLKGTGWYETDFKSDKENKRNLAVEKDADSGSSEGAGGGKPSDSAKAADTKSTDAKSADAKPAESKSADSKGGDTKSSEGSSKSESAGASRGRSRPNLAKPSARTAAKSKAKAAPARRRGR